MKLEAVVVMAILGSSVAIGQSLQGASKVTICLHDSGRLVLGQQAAAMAKEMYAAIGVSLERQSGLRSCKAEGVINIELTDHTPVKLMPGALAYALPYEGIHIRVFYDRLENVASVNGLPYLLAHVLVHEVGHILQGVVRHSATGVMKAYWIPEDYQLMKRSFLPFTEEDVHLIHTGIEKRSARLLAANIDVQAGPAK